ncbi:carbohydrate kinase [Microbacterium yannicii]|uniref:Carbohydrate kinase n=1 Tax=Microbacterium yannicii TaxID=671622 RepID=A0ABP9MBV5_9MICO|nr:carbohydrate kinase [Microbacterium yannicii]MCO5952927.1 carbohydrate kinase [Microbacterium yannicii]
MTALVIGEALIDVVSEPGRPERRTPGGGPFNVAIGLARLQIPTALLAHVGTDADGQLLLDALEDAGATFVGERVGVTSTAHAHLAEDGSATYRFALDWDPHLAGEFSTDRLWGAVHVGSLGAFLRPGRELVDRLLEHEPARLRSFDPNIRPGLVGPPDEARSRVEAIAGRIDVLKLSDEDAAWLYPGVDIADVIAMLLASGPSLIAVTRGGDGSVIATHEHTVEIAAPRTQVVDTIGAGDAYMSAMLGALILNDAVAVGIENLSADVLLDIGGMASRAAAFVVAHAGSNPPTFEQLRG